MIIRIYKFINIIITFTITVIRFYFPKLIFIFVKILHIDIKYAIGISVFSAAIGALISYVYLCVKNKNTISYI